MKTKCIIVDDEPLAIKLIRNHLQKFEFIEVVAECRNAVKAMEILKSENVELMFLDIQMPQITGLEFLRAIPHPPYVIITTAYREYALDGYDLDVIDYLLKPISFERLLKAINKFCERRGKKPGSHSVTEEDDHQAFIYIQDGKINYKIHLNQILFLEGYGEYIKIHTPEKTYLTRNSMSDFEKKLGETMFLRIHKSYIISKIKISAFSSSTVLIGNIELPIGRSYKENVLRNLK